MIPRFVVRMHRASLLDAPTYEEVEHDRGANLQAAAVVVLSAVAAGIGSLAFIVASLLGWLVWAAVTLVIGTRLLPGPETSADLGELLRTIGFSCAPGMVRVFGLITPIGGFVFLIGSLWMLVAMVIAVRQALDYRGTGRAILVCAIGFPVYFVMQVGSLLLLGPWPI